MMPSLFLFVHIYVHAYVFSVASFVFLIDTFGNYHKYKWEYTVNVPTYTHKQLFIIMYFYYLLLLVAT